VRKIIYTILALSLSMLYFLIPAAPYVYIGFHWIAVLLFFLFSSKRDFIKITVINLSAVILCLTLFEAYLWFRSGEIYITRKVSPGYYELNKYLGYVPVKDGRIRETKYYKDDKIFDVVYSFDQNRLRVSPPSRTQNPKGCILFLGGSYTYGLGVKDSETMPYQVGIKTFGEYRIYNFGVSGYGPHQMLSALENNIVNKIVKCKDYVYAIYQAIPDHINRAAGLSSWDYHGPRYVLENSNKINLAGNFDDITLPKIGLKYLNKSIIYRDLIGNRRFFNRNKDLELYLNIVSAAKERFEKQYPYGEFHIIFWNNLSGVGDASEEMLNWKKASNYFKQNGFNVHLTGNIIPEYSYNKLKYILSPFDNHPNALTYNLLSDYVVKNILD